MTELTDYQQHILAKSEAAKRRGAKKHYKNAKRAFDDNAAWTSRKREAAPKRTATRAAQVRFALANLDN